MAPQGNPSGYGPAAAGGRDPNTGAVLRDRFHQLRGNEFEMMRGTGMASRIAEEFLTSRGAPVTPQNMAIAQSYLSGGGLDMLEQQQSTESGIADAAMAADGGGAGGVSVASPASAGVPPAAAPVAPVAAPPAGASVPPSYVGQDAMPVDNTSGGIPWILPALAAATGGGTALATRGTPDPGLNGEIVNDVATRAPAGMPAANAVDQGIEDAIIMGVNPAATDNALPPPSPLEQSLEQPRGENPYAARTMVTPPPAGPARQLPAPETAAPAESKPVATEDIVSQSEGGTKQSVPGPNGETITKEGGTYKATGKGGKVVTGKTVSAVRSALRALR